MGWQFQRLPATGKALLPFISYSDTLLVKQCVHVTQQECHLTAAAYSITKPVWGEVEEGREEMLAEQQMGIRVCINCLHCIIDYPQTDGLKVTVSISYSFQGSGIQEQFS